MFNYDVNEVDTSTEIKGEFPASITGIKKTLTKENPRDMIVADFKIFGDKYKGVVFKNYYVVDSPTANGTKNFFRLVDMLDINRDSFGNEAALKQFIGKQVMIEVGKQKKDDKYSSILKTLKYEAKESVEAGEF